MSDDLTVLTSLDFHRAAEEAMAMADVQADPEFKRDASRLAALLETLAMERIPRDRPRTRGIIGVSAIALYVKAGDVDRAAAFTEKYATEDVPEWAIAEMRDIVAGAHSTPDAESVAD